MAPEQFEGLVSTKSDQYSLGCIAYELVTGQRLFTIPNRSLEAYWFHHAKVEPTPPTHYHPHIPAHIEQAILKALMKERNHRFIDVPAFNKALLTNGKEWNVDTSKEQTKAAQIVAIPLKLQRQPKSKNPNLDEFDQIIGEAPLPDGNVLPEGYCIWRGKTFMYLGKCVDGEWRRYGNQNTVWYTKADDWSAMQRWLTQVSGEWFRNYNGTNDPPTEEQRIYAPMPK